MAATLGVLVAELGLEGTLEEVVLKELETPHLISLKAKGGTSLAIFSLTTNFPLSVLEVDLVYVTLTAHGARDSLCLNL